MLTSSGRRNVDNWVIPIPSAPKDIRRYLEIHPMTKPPTRGGHEALRLGLDNENATSPRAHP